MGEEAAGDELARVSVVQQAPRSVARYHGRWEPFCRWQDGVGDGNGRKEVTHASPSSTSASSSPPARAKSSSSMSDMFEEVELGLRRKGDDFGAQNGQKRAAKDDGR